MNSAPPKKKVSILRRVYAELRFSGESLRINARAMLFALAVGLLVGVCGGTFSRLLSLADTLRDSAVWVELLLPLAGLLVVWIDRKSVV